MQDNESLREFVKRFGQAVLQVEACSMDVSYRSSSEASVQALHFSNHWLKSLLQRWMTYSDEPTNIQCSKMTCVQPPNKFWLPDDHLEVTERNAKPPDRPRPSIEAGGPSGQDPKEQTHPQGIIARDVSSKGTRSHDRNMQEPPVSGREAHQGRTSKAISPLRY
ncbi:hypothetical protein CK203_041254 [Vitis vinifera]|uniref:Retrotransposon gag domain-containing protein n=1 Tax=Vitis vinifera TaxID=29760 RepID=A0A438HIZ9_VITVI|nr:hypothetical protein CK203_041254 [Vitis vinifera]